jgi:polysaccharide biosynthesis transport protein
MDLAGHIAAIWRHKWIVLVASIVVAAFTYLFTSVQHKVYQATAQLNVVVGQSSSQSPETLSPYLAQSDAALAKTSPVLKEAVKLARLNLTELQASSDVSVDNPSGLGYLQVAATGPSRAAATSLANGLTQALIQAVNNQATVSSTLQTTLLQNETNSINAQLQNPNLSTSERVVLEDQLSALDAAYAQELAQGQNGLSIVSPASGLSSPVSPTPKRSAAFALVAALVVISELSVGYELLSDRFSRNVDDEEIKNLTGLPILARVPMGDGADLVEAFRTLRTSLLFRGDADETRTIAVISTMPRVGKTFVSVNLACSFADLGINTALVDGDMRRPSIASEVGIADVPGLSEALVDGNVANRMAPVRRARESQNKVDLLPAGDTAADPAALLTGHLSELVLPALAGYDIVVFDTPAEHYFPDAAIISSRCDAAIVVIDTQITKRRSLKVILEHLYRVGGNPVGVVVNRSSNAATGSYYYRARKPSRRRDPDIGPRGTRSRTESRPSPPSKSRPIPKVVGTPRHGVR